MSVFCHSRDINLFPLPLISSRCKRSPLGTVRGRSRRRQTRRQSFPLVNQSWHVSPWPPSIYFTKTQGSEHKFII